MQPPGFTVICAYACARVITLGVWDRVVRNLREGPNGGTGRCPHGVLCIWGLWLTLWVCTECALARGFTLLVHMPPPRAITRVGFARGFALCPYTCGTHNRPTFVPPPDSTRAHMEGKCTGGYMGVYTGCLKGPERVSGQVQEDAYNPHLMRVLYPLSASTHPL